MAGIYIHIPFCKQACHYCDFHFSTSLKKKEPLLKALRKELILRKAEIASPIQCIYFGGGTPSLLTSTEIDFLLQAISENYTIANKPEITLEANPDDLSDAVLKKLAATKINRLSIGIQSFFEEDLQLMNRAHNAKEAFSCIKMAKKYFDNISIDLIYGIPGMRASRWQENLKTALALDLPHISSYALTVEPNTALKVFIEKGKVKPIDEEQAKRHFELLVETLTKNGFVNYEFSNFGKPGYFSQNNTAYWMGKPYLGIGPSAHSFNKNTRSWNVANNSKYIKAIEDDVLPSQEEKLSVTDRYNEYIMTRLRTMWGISATEIKTQFGEKYWKHFNTEAKVFFEKGMLEEKNNTINIAQKAKFLSDGIASELFFLN